jgi:hypothetical protein
MWLLIIQHSITKMAEVSWMRNSQRISTGNMKDNLAELSVNWKLN